MPVRFGAGRNERGGDVKDVLQGVRVLEVAAWTFVPASGAVLAEWGADVIKVEHPVGGDAQRGLITSGLVPAGAGGVNYMIELPNRGKRSVAIDISTDEGRELLYQLAEKSDVFVSSFLPAARKKLRIDVDDIRARNPRIIYVRGSGLGVRGEEAGKPSYDATAFWSRGGLAMAFTQQGEWPTTQRPGFGDVLGGMSLAGGIAAALFRRERTGTPSIVDVSLLGLALWALGPDVTAAKLYEGVEVPTFDKDSPPNPIMGAFPTSDGRFLMIVLLQPDRFWPELCERIERPDLLEDERFKDAAARFHNRRECTALLRDIFRERTLDQWKERFATFSGAWAPMQSALEVHDDPQVEANGYLPTVVAGNGSPFRMPANPVQFDETPPSPTGAPEHGQHTEEVLLELGLTWEQIAEHKDKGAIL